LGAEHRNKEHPLQLISRTQRAGVVGIEVAAYIL